MMYYSCERFKNAAGSFVDTSDESVALAIVREAYDEDYSHAYVLYRYDGEATGEPTHILIHDVMYKLVEVEETT